MDFESTRADSTRAEATRAESAPATATFTATLEMGTVESPNRPGRANADEGVFVPGEVLADRFRIERFLGRGGMGQVFEAFDSELGVPVAIKAIRPEQNRNPEAVRRFKQEVHLARQVTHGNVCRIFDLFFHHDPNAWGRPGRPVIFLTMELLEGESLSDYLARRGPLSPADALPLIRDMAGALDAAHGAGIVHRDFKSANVMLVHDGTRQRAIVTDFGLAHTPHADGQVRSARRGGTPAYMAPEQRRGEQVTAAADIYSFGVVLCEMLTGCRPAVGDEESGADRWQEMDLDKLSKVEAARWRSVLDRCSSERPEDRFERAGDVVEAVSGGRNGRHWGLGLVSVAAAATASIAAAGILTIGLPETTSEPSIRSHPGIDRDASVGLMSNDVERSAELYAEALRKRQVFDEVAARDLLEQAVAADRNAIHARSTLAMVLNYLGASPEAREMAWEAWELADELPEPDRSEVEARYLMSVKEPRAASRIYRRLVEGHPERSSFGLELAWAYFASGQRTAGVAALEDLRERIPEFEAAGDPLVSPRIDLMAVLGALEYSDFETAHAHAVRASSFGREKGLPSLEAHALLWVAEADWRRGRLDLASEAVREAQEILIPGGARGDIARLLRLRGNIAMSHRDTEAGAHFYQNLIDLGRRLGYDRMTFTGMHNLGIVYSELGELADARRVFEHFLNHARRRGVERSRLLALLNLAAISRGQGDFESAESYAIQGIEAAPFGRPLERALLDANRAGVRRDRGDLEGSARYLEESLASFRQLGVRLNIAWSVSAQGDLKALAADFEGAREDYQSALEMVQEIGHRGASMRRSLAWLALMEGDPATAERLATELLQADGTKEGPASIAESLLILANAELDSGRAERAFATWERVRELIGEEHEYVRLRLPSKLLHARLLGSKDLLAGIEAAHEALDDANHNGPMELRFRARQILGELEMAHGHSAREGRGVFRLLELAADAERLGFESAAIEARRSAGRV